MILQILGFLRTIMLMAKLNSHYKKLRREYIFPIIEQKLAELEGKVSLINLGIGDISLPLAPSVAQAIQGAVQEMTTSEGKRGYGPSEGYLFLREAIARHAYAHVGIAPDEIFISDGANTDTANIQEIFSSSVRLGIADPTYPVYLDTNIMAGRGKKITLLPCTEKSRFCPVPPGDRCDVIYLCTPGNPTGVAMTRKEMQAWVDYAHQEKALLLIDNAYEAFVTSNDVPQTIFEIEGAKEVAIEFRSFSKSAGFTGLRCAYTVLPKQLHKGAIHALWKRRQATKSNGVAYPIQRGAEAVFSPQGHAETKAQVATYQKAATILRDGILKLGYTCWGGIDAPYIWWKTPKDLSSWEFFDQLLHRCHILAIPGRGFGEHGEGYVRLSTFTTPEMAQSANERLCALC
jgi:LL-diaminopimelate aminotransferase